MNFYIARHSIFLHKHFRPGALKESRTVFFFKSFDFDDWQLLLLDFLSVRHLLSDFRLIAVSTKRFRAVLFTQYFFFWFFFNQLLANERPA